MTAAITLPIDVTDVPMIEAQNLQHVMHMLIQSGRGLALLNGLDEKALKEIDTAIWDELEVAPEDRLATSLRFRCLVAVFGSKRLKDLLLQNGFPLIVQAVALSARMRLNIRYGFSPTRFHMALQGALEAPAAIVAEDAIEAPTLRLAA